MTRLWVNSQLTRIDEELHLEWSEHNPEYSEFNPCVVELLASVRECVEGLNDWRTGHRIMSSDDLAGLSVN